MPILAERNDELGVWELSTTGALTLDEIVRLVDEHDWERAPRVLWDLRNLEEAPRTSPELRLAADLLEEAHRRLEGGRTAIVVARDLDFGLARMFQAFADGAGVRYEIFRDREAALAWLLDPSQR